MQIDAKESGRIEVPETSLFTFPQGVYGFQAHRQFAVLKDRKNAGNPFMWLQSAMDKNVCFAVLDAAVLFQDYCPPVPGAVADLLHLSQGDTPHYLVIANLPQADSRLFLNLKCPVVLNPAACLGAQVILEDEHYPMRYYLPAKGGV